MSRKEISNNTEDISMMRLYRYHQYNINMAEAKLVDIRAHGTIVENWKFSFKSHPE